MGSLEQIPIGKTHVRSKKNGPQRQGKEPEQPRGNENIEPESVSRRMMHLRNPHGPSRARTGRCRRPVPFDVPAAASPCFGCSGTTAGVTGRVPPTPSEWRLPFHPALHRC